MGAERLHRRRDQDENRWFLQEGKLALLRTAADESARHVRGLYFKFLLFAFYVAVTVLSTNDERILKGIGAKLPFLDVNLPLVEFYVVVPWLVLIFHAHLLSQFYLLSRKLFDLDHELGSLPSESARIQRGLLFPLIFSHRIVGAQHPRLIRRVFGAAVIVTVLVVPIALLLAVQWKFLPYHGAWITFNHQLVFSLDLLLLWIFWPRLSSRSGRWRDWWTQSRSKWGIWVSTVSGVLVSTILLLGAWILVVPYVGGIEEWLVEKWLTRDEEEELAGNRQGLPWIHRNLVLRERVLMRKEPPAELLFEARGKAEEEKWVREEAGEALDLRDRDLRYADFYDSKLWNADLRGARLEGAVLIDAQLQGADLRVAQLQGADLRWARLQGANLQVAQLQGAGLRGAQLQGADLRSARLQGAVLRWAQLQIADLSWAQLQGANLSSAQLEGADLQGARLQGANLRWAQLQGADLSYTNFQGAVLAGARLQIADLQEAQLEGADLQGARLQIADLRSAQLQGADLVDTQLQGADLRGARLQIADLSWAQLQGADLREAVVYGTDFRGAEFSLADLRGLCSLPVGWEGPSESWFPSGEPDWEPFSEIEALEAKLEQEGEQWSQRGRKRVEQAIDRFWSAALVPFEPMTISPPKKSNVIHDRRGLFAKWPAPPEGARLEQIKQMHAKYRAGLACKDRYIAERMWRHATWDDPVLEQALRAKAASGACPVLAEVLKKYLNP